MTDTMIGGAKVHVTEVTSVPCPWDLRTKEGAVSFSEAILQGARMTLEKEGRVTIVAFVMATTDPNGKKFDQPVPLLVPQSASPDGSKDGLSWLVKTLAEQTRAVGVLFVSETWMLEMSGKSQAEYHRERAKYEDLGDHPDSTEWVYAHLEHTAVNVLWRGPISRTEDGKPVLGEYEKRDGYEMSGRFSGLHHNFDSDQSLN